MTGVFFMRIAVVYGGIGEEREVSLLSGARVSEALQKEGHTVLKTPLSCALPNEEQLTCFATCDAVFLVLHGGAGENGQIQSALERAGVYHYTGSGPLASRLAMDKVRAKRCVAAFGVPVAAHIVLQKGEKREEPPFLPLVAKPVGGGSSVGLCSIRSREEWVAFSPACDVLCEPYLSGREFSVGVLDRRALPPVLIEPVGGEYDFAHKYTAGATCERCPAPVERAYCARLQNLALLAAEALGLRDYARIDFREDARGTPIFLEANTLPGMTEQSLFPLAARAAGVSMGALCTRMAELAARRRVGMRQGG